MANFSVYLILLALLPVLPVLLTGGPRLLALAGPTPQPQYFVNDTYATPTCKAKYTCGSGTQEVFECSCHRYCNMFDSCCDSMRTASAVAISLIGMSSPLALDTFSCVSIFDITAKLKGTFASSTQGADAIHVVTKCPASYQRTSTRRLCEHPLSQTDNGTLSTFVTDDFTGFTYRNVYCALCHNIMPGKVWSAYNVCSTPRNSPTPVCRTGYLPPGAFPTSWLHSCIFGTIQSCPDTAKLLRRVNCASSPTQLVYDNFNQAVYRNWNCSSCYAPASPLWECSRGWSSSSAANENALTSVAIGESRDYLCPRQLSASMQSNEMLFWQAQCPKLCKLKPAVGKK